jgi:hypothetical protein
MFDGMWGVEPWACGFFQDGATRNREISTASAGWPEPPRIVYRGLMTSKTRLDAEARPGRGAPASSQEAFDRADDAHAFGPSFFLHHLNRFVRDRCPETSEDLPLVQIRLGDGSILEICHIVSVSPRWVMVAIDDPASTRDRVSVVFVPYESIRRIDITTRQAAGDAIGFSQRVEPKLVAPEALLRSAMAGPDDFSS